MAMIGIDLLMWVNPLPDKARSENGQLRQFADEVLPFPPFVLVAVQDLTRFQQSLKSGSHQLDIDRCYTR